MRSGEPCEGTSPAKRRVNVIASLIDPKFAHDMVRKLNQASPLENLRHIKRIRKKHLDDGMFLENLSI